MPLIFESFDLTGFDLVISVSSEFAKSVITQPQQLHVCYLLTPTRYLWSHQREYLFSLPKSVQPLASWLFSRLQKWDYVAARRPDLIVPISNLVATRAYEFYDLVTAAPIYPPLKNYQTNKKEKKLTKFTSDYIFSWGRLVRYKKFDLLIKAAIRAQKKLYIAGVGPDKHRLQKIARQLDPQRQWIHFLGYLEPSELVEYISKAKVAAFVQVEDFGLVALEAVAQGCPVIVNRKSGVAEVLTQKQAFFVDSFSLQELTDTLNKSFAQTRSKLDIMFPTSHYAEEKWQVKFKSQLEDYWQIYQTKLKEEHGITS